MDIHIFSLIVGLWDPFYDVHMGNLADMCAQKYEITREQAVSHRQTCPDGYCKHYLVDCYAL